LAWWKAVLSVSGGSHSLQPRKLIDPDIWVDASTSWGLGIVVGERWAAWRLSADWKRGDRDIGWAEAVALELAVLWLVQDGYSDCEIKIKGDNTGVIGAFNKGRSRNISRNNSIRRIATLLVPYNITILPSYVTSATNRADPISRGILGSHNLRLACSFELPSEIFPLIQSV